MSRTRPRRCRRRRPDSRLSATLAGAALAGLVRAAVDWLVGLAGDLSP
ncbi:hypothetical protein AB0B01_24985 [Streptomyces sp. NPDC044571]